MTASVRQQADGSVRVQFDASGARDPGLIDRVSRGYDSRMGRYWQASAAATSPCAAARDATGETYRCRDADIGCGG